MRWNSAISSARSASPAWFNADTGACSSLLVRPRASASSTVLGRRSGERASASRARARRCAAPRGAPESAAIVGTTARPSSHCRKCAGLLGDHPLGLVDRFAADVEVALHDLGEIVDAVQENVLERGRLGLDVARHPEVDDEHRRVAALADHALEQALADDRQRARRAGDDDVELRQPLGQLGERDRAGTETVGQRLAALERPVGDGDRASACARRNAWRRARSSRPRRRAAAAARQATERCARRA